MKRLLLFLLFLLAPASALAQPTYDLSCDNVAQISIVRDEVSPLAQRAPDGVVHGVTFYLKPEFLHEFQAFAEVSRLAQLPLTAKPRPWHAGLSVTANGKPLPCDILEIRGYGGKKVITFLFNEQDATDLARAVCPALVPYKVHMAGQEAGTEGTSLPPVELVEPPLDMLFDISCENVTKVTIIRQKDSWLHLHTPQGFVYLIFFQLNPEAGDRFGKLVEASRAFHPLGDGGVFYKPQLTVTANGKPLQNDVSGVEGNGNGRVGTVIISKQETFNLAREVCPTAPVEFLDPYERPQGGPQQ